MNHHLCFNSLTFVKLHLFAESLIFLPSWHPCVMFPADRNSSSLSITSQGISLHIYTIGFQNVLIQLDHYEGDDIFIHFRCPGRILEIEIYYPWSPKLDFDFIEIDLSASAGVGQLTSSTEEGQQSAVS